MFLIGADMTIASCIARLDGIIAGNVRAKNEKERLRRAILNSCGRAGYGGNCCFHEHLITLRGLRDDNYPGLFAVAQAAALCELRPRLANGMCCPPPPPPMGI